MGYEIEVSLNIKKYKSVKKLLELILTMVKNYGCERYYQFSDDTEVRKKRKILLFCFDNEKFENMILFLKEIIIQKIFYLESVYETNNYNLIYVSSYYMTLMENEKKDEYKKKHINHLFSERDYIVLKCIKKINK